MSDHLVRTLRHIARDADRLALEIFIAIEAKDWNTLMALDLTALTALGPRIDAVASQISTLVSGDVATAVAAETKANQAQLDSAVADLTTRVANLETAAAGAGGGGGTTQPGTLTISPTSLAVSVGQPNSGSFSFSGGVAPYTVTPATSSDGGLAVDATGAYTGSVTTAGTSTLTIAVADSSVPPLTASLTVLVTAS